jgi:hypothetical protein
MGRIRFNAYVPQGITAERSPVKRCELWRIYVEAWLSVDG